jgi:hypothetical protein
MGMYVSGPRYVYVYIEVRTYLDLYTDTPLYHSLIKQQKNDENIMNTKLIICVLRSNCNGNPLCTIGSVNERVIGLTE